MPCACGMDGRVRVMLKPAGDQTRQTRRAAWGIEMAVLVVSALGLVAFALYAIRVW